METVEHKQIFPKENKLPSADLLQMIIQSKELRSDQPAPNIFFDNRNVPKYLLENTTSQDEFILLPYAFDGARHLDREKVINLLNNFSQGTDAFGSNAYEHPAIVTPIEINGKHIFLIYVSEVAQPPNQNNGDLSNEETQVYRGDWLSSAVSICKNGLYQLPGRACFTKNPSSLWSSDGRVTVAYKIPRSKLIRLAPDNEQYSLVISAKDIGQKLPKTIKDSLGELKFYDPEKFVIPSQTDLEKQVLLWGEFAGILTYIPPENIDTQLTINTNQKLAQSDDPAFDRNTAHKFEEFLRN